MGKQRRFTADELSRIAAARSAVSALPPWVEIPGGEVFWADAMVKLSDAQVFGTTDGQPWRELEAEGKPESESEPIADVVCLTDPDNCEAVYIDGNLVIASETVCLGELAREVEGKVIRLRQFNCDNDRQWPKLLSDLNCEKVQHIAADEPPIDAEFEVVADVEPVIDDKWAAVWPRRWVMCRERDSWPWVGPYRLGMVNDKGHRFMVFDKHDTRTPFAQARPATAEEIATVEPPEPAKPEIGEGYREATEADSPRCDLQEWNPHSRCWEPGFIVGTDTTYRVPIDREPTAEDAKDQPRVMAWNEDGEKPILAKFLNRVDDRSRPFICCDGIRIIDAKFARHLRSYE